MFEEDQRPRGFTLVELLVVIAIIGILTALLLPAVQAAREAARRMQCGNHLKQLALAMHIYHDAHHCLPASGYCFTNNPWSWDTIAACHTWIESLLPYIEQQAVFDQLDFNVRITEGVNPSLIDGLVISSLLCPSDPEAGLYPNTRELGRYLPQSGESMGASYIPCAGPVDLGNTSSGDSSCAIPAMEPNFNCKRWIGEEGTSLIWDNEGPGMFTMGRIARRFSAITDGLTNTFLLGESLPIYSSFRMYFVSHFHVGSVNSPPNYHKAYPYCRSRDQRMPQPPPCHAYMAAFMSEHPGGVNMAMADGSIHFIGENIEYFVWCVLGDRDSGASVSAGSY